MIDKLIYYMQYPFVHYAIIVGVAVALCSSLLGVTLVLKRFSFIGDGLSHVAFGAIAIASVLRLIDNTTVVSVLQVTNNMILVTEYKNQRRCGNCNDFRRRACIRLSDFECI